MFTLFFKFKCDLLSIVMCGRRLILHSNRKLVTCQLKRINNNNNSHNNYCYCYYYYYLSITSNSTSEARLDMKAGGFWSRGVTAFFDVRVTHVSSKCN